jgi:MFS family permease
MWVGLLASFTGAFMRNAALLWHVSMLVAPEHKGLALGMVGLVQVVPIVIFSLVSGVVADALDRRLVMIATQGAASCVGLALGLLALRGSSTVWPLYALAALGAVVGTFDLPARQALVPSLVPREHLPNAISLNAIAVQAASVLGPSIGGLVIASKGVGPAYLVHAVLSCCTIVALLLVRDLPREARDAAAEGPDQSDRPSFSWHAALEGLRFVFRSPLIRSTMLLDCAATFFSSATALLPIFAQEILRVGARGYGWLYAAPAAGALVTSALMVPLTERINRRGQTLLWAVLAYGAATVAFGMSRSFSITFLCLALTGASDTVSMVIRNVVRQLETPDRLRGRMTSVNMIFFMGGPQLGELEAGLVANWLGAPFSVISGGIGCLIATVWVAATTPALRRYRRGAEAGV